MGRILWAAYYGKNYGLLGASKWGEYYGNTAAIKGMLERFPRYWLNVSQWDDRGNFFSHGVS